MGTMFQAADWFVRTAIKAVMPRLPSGIGMATSCSATFSAGTAHEILERDENNVARSGPSNQEN